uniref:Reverse transcriptase domain-containing protein n=1 Tax=Tanacetum cinerariifolium TaxID=118510 RepID=A0A6L2JZB4_TANCI|nr:reverse transcriptase domain-containing protein [Tanacetum cinerariifolium]
MAVTEITVLWFEENIIRVMGNGQLATNGVLREVVTTCEKSQVRVSSWGFSFKELPSGSISDEALREYYDKNYHQILPIIAKKLYQEKAHQEKLKAVKARLNFEEVSRSGRPEPRRNCSKSPREKDLKKRTVFKGLEKGVFYRLGDKEKNVSVHSRGTERKSYYSIRRDTESCYQSSLSKETEIASEKHRHKREYSRRTKAVSEKTNLFTPRIRYFDFPKARMASHIKTYDGSEDPEHHLKVFQAAATTERWAMPTWCHIFNSTLTRNATVWFDDLPKESIDSYDDLRKAFLENYLQQKKCIKDPVEIHNIKQRDKESTEEFMRRYKLECRDVKGDPECMKISGFMHEITNPELIKRLHDKIPMSKDEMMSEAGQKQNFKRGNFRSEQRTERKQDRFTLLTKTPKQILALDKGKFKPLSPMINPVEKRNASKFYEFHVEPWQKIARQRVTQIFSPESIITFPTLGEEDGREGPMIIEAEMGGHCLIPANTPLVGFSGEIIWPLGQISLLVKIGDEEHSSSSWMNFMVVRSPSPYNRIIGRPGTIERGQAPERNKVIGEEVKTLVEADIIKEVHYHSWLSNPVMVKKHDDSWRMCVDFKDLNKACPKDGYPLPKIDWKVESLCGYPYKCFLDAYKGYHQIKMAEEDEEKTAFITSQGIFYDLVIKSRMEKEVIRDIEETFKTLREINMKLNPKTCAFGMRVGTFLGYKVDANGLRVCPNKVKAILNLPSPKCLKDVQKLNGKLASLNRFLSKSAEKSLPFFKTLKNCTKKSNFQWTVEAEMAFKGMKQLIAELPMLMAPKEKEELIIACYSVPTKDASKRTNSGGLHRGASGGRHTRYINGRHGRTPTPMDIIHGQIIMHRRPDSWSLDSRENGSTKSLSKCGLKTRSQPGALSKIASTSFAHLSKQALVEELREKSIDEKEILAVVEEERHTWMTLVYEYLTEWVLPEEKKKARAVRRKAGRYAVINKVLHKKSFFVPWLRFGLPGEIVSDNEKQFRDNPFKDWYEKLRETPFSLTFGAKAVIPVEISIPTLTTAELIWSRIMKPWGSAWIFWKKRESKLQYRKQGAKPKWKNITTPRSEAQAFVQEALSTRTTKQVMRKTGQART